MVGDVGCGELDVGDGVGVLIVPPLSPVSPLPSRTNATVKTTTRSTINTIQNRIVRLVKEAGGGSLYSSLISDMGIALSVTSAEGLSKSIGSADVGGFIVTGISHGSGDCGVML